MARTLSRVGTQMMFESVSVGDCCLFQVRGPAAVELIQVPAVFTDHPAVVSNVRERVEELPRDSVVRRPGSVHSGEVFVLTSDALGEALQGFGADMDWSALAKLGQRRFRAMITELREQRAIVNDDVTLLVVEVL